MTYGGARQDPLGERSGERVGRVRIHLGSARVSGWGASGSTWGALG